MYSYRTNAGVFEIVLRAGRWHVMYQGDSLGSYVSPHQAADDLANGHTFTPSNGTDTGSLGISEDIGEWEHQKI